MTTLELEAWSELSCDLDHEQAVEIAAAGLVEVRARPGSERWCLVAGAKVGIAVGPGWEVRVRPRIQVPQLLFLLAYATDPGGWREPEAGFEASEDLFDAIAHGFSQLALRLAEQGVLHGYAEVEERSPTIRGRIRFADQLARAALPLPVEVSYDEYTPNIAENRILKTATEVLLRLPRIGSRPRGRLLKLRSLLDQVDLEPRPREAVMPRITRLNQRYRPALALAQLIFRASSLTHARGPLASASYLFDMNRVFEDFVSVALGEAMASFGGEVRLQRPGYLDTEGRVKFRPDVEWFRDGATRAVIDAKHKSLASQGVPNEDAYQMLAYCTALNLRRGYLVYAHDAGVAAHDIDVKNSECEVRVRTVDLALEPPLLLDRIADLANEVAV